MIRWILLLVCSGTVLLSTGCGGSSDSGQRLSRAELQSRANQICTDLSHKEKPDLGATSKPGIDRNLDRLDSALNDLARLNPPAADEARYQAFVHSFKRGVAFAREKEELLILLTRQMRAHPTDFHTAAHYRSVVRPFVEEIRVAAKNATALGLTACANGLSGGSSSTG